MPHDPIARWENEGGAVLSVSVEDGRQLRYPGCEREGARRAPAGDVGAATSNAASPQASPSRDQGWINPRLIA